MRLFHRDLFLPRVASFLLTRGYRDIALTGQIKMNRLIVLPLYATNLSLKHTEANVLSAFTQLINS
jgi:hypothetical protein